MQYRKTKWGGYLQNNSFTKIVKFISCPAFLLFPLHSSLATNEFYDLTQHLKTISLKFEGNNSANVQYCVANAYDGKDSTHSQDYYYIKGTFSLNKTGEGDNFYKISLEPDFPTGIKDQTELLDYYSPLTHGERRGTHSGTNFSLGGNVGFFGLVPTGGVHGNYGWSVGESTEIPEVRTLVNKNAHHIDWHFEMMTQTTADNTFNVAVTSIWKFPYHLRTLIDQTLISKDLKDKQFFPFRFNIQSGYKITENGIHQDDYNYIHTKTINDKVADLPSNGYQRFFMGAMPGIGDIYRSSTYISAKANTKRKELLEKQKNTYDYSKTFSLPRPPRVGMWVPKIEESAYAIDTSDVDKNIRLAFYNNSQKPENNAFFTVGIKSDQIKITYIDRNFDASEETVLLDNKRKYVNASNPLIYPNILFSALDQNNQVYFHTYRNNKWSEKNADIKSLSPLSIAVFQEKLLLASVDTDKNINFNLYNFTELSSDETANDWKIKPSNQKPYKLYDNSDKSIKVNLDLYKNTEMALVTADSKAFLAFPNEKNEIIFGYCNGNIRAWQLDKIHDWKTELPISMAIWNDYLYLTHIGLDTHLYFDMTFIKDPRWFTKSMRIDLSPAPARSLSMTLAQFKGEEDALYLGYISGNKERKESFMLKRFMLEQNKQY